MSEQLSDKMHITTRRTLTVQTADEHRPDPIGNALKSVGAGVSAVLGIVGFLVGAGVLTAAQGDALTTLGEGVNVIAPTVGGVVSGLAALVSGFLAAWATGKTARQEVTPVRDPRTNDGSRMVVHPDDA